MAVLWVLSQAVHCALRSGTVTQWWPLQVYDFHILNCSLELLDLDPGPGQLVLIQPEAA